MHPALIKAAIQVAGTNQAQIARELSVSPVAVNHTVHGRMRSARVERQIGIVTGLELADLWPQWYGPRTSPADPAAGRRLLRALRAVGG